MATIREDMDEDLEEVIHVLVVTQEEGKINEIDNENLYGNTEILKQILSIL